MTTLVSKDFMRDFAQLANFYGWDGRVLDEVKEQTRNSAELRNYWQDLAAAHRVGYKQTKGNQWERLECFKQRIAEEARTENPYGRREDDRPPPHRR